MKRKNPFATLTTWLALALTPASGVVAAENNPAGVVRQSGEVTGQVTNAATRTFLEGAVVTLVGTTRTTITDREGRFRFTGLPAGPMRLVVTYTGLNLREIPVAVLSRESIVVDVALTSDVYMMDTFTVASIREGQALALTQQRNAPNVKNVVATDAFGNIADGNAAEALRFLPGVSAVNDQHESRFVMVRGINANLNSVTFDGMKLASGGSGTDRQTGMSEIPLGAIETLEVTKSPTPDMDGDSIGGNINLRPASIFDRVNPRRITYAASASGRVTGKSLGASAYTSNRIRPTYSFGYSNVFGKERNIGVALNLSRTTNWVPMGGLMVGTWEQADVTPAYLRVYQHFDYHSTERSRSGVNVRLDYKLSEKFLFYINSFYTYYDSQQAYEGGNSIVTGLAQVVTLDANGRPIPFQTQFPFGHPSYRAGTFNTAGNRVQASILPGYTDEITDMVNATYQFGGAPNKAVTKRYSFQPGGRHRFGELEVDYSGIYQESPNWSGQKDRRRDLIRGYSVQVTNTAWRLDSTGTDSILRRDMTQTGGPDVGNPQNWTLGGLVSTVIERGTDIYGGQVNLKRSFGEPVPVYFKTGLKYMSEERYTSNPNKAFTYVGTQGAVLSSLVNTSLKTDIAPDKWHPYNAIPSYLDLAKINALRDEHPEYFAENLATSLQNELQNDKIAREQVFAGYIMANVNLGRLSVLGGLRVERTVVSGESAVQDPLRGVGIVEPVQRIQAIWGQRRRVERDYQNVLPGIHFKYQASSNILTRASYSASFGRPGFGSIYPDTRINYETERITQNNPGLLPQVADNFDVSIERYFEPVGIVSVGVFLKEIKNYLYNAVVSIPSGSDNGFEGEYAGWDLATQANGGSARVRGVELNYSQQLSFLPGIWKGFGVFANFTYLETTGDYGRISEAPNSALESFMPRVVSAGLSYGRRSFSARINGHYTGTWLRTYNANPLLRVHEQPRTMIDLKLAYRFTPAVTVFMDATNIFNDKQYWHRGPRVYRIQDNGTRIQMGVSGNL